MNILTVDVGTGTQDIFLFDSRLDVENGYKLVLPSPTLMVQKQLLAATARRRPVLLTGWLMGGGPSQWAARDHVRAGNRLYATPEAARTFNDDLTVVEKEMGVQIVSDEEGRALGEQVLRLELKDLDLAAITDAFARFGVTLRPEAVAVAVFDHGDAPPAYSDRQFRFDYLDTQCRRRPELSTFAHREADIPASMTRLRAVAASARTQGVEGPLLVMDTAPAAALGATLDPRVAEAVADEGCLVANIGNFHCLAFRLSTAGIEGVFEHHTGEVTREKLDHLLAALASSTLRHADVYEDMGHGALVYQAKPLPAPWFLAVVGPRRALLRGSRHRPYFAVPFGDMMLTGNFGLLRAFMDVYPEYAEPVRHSLAGAAGRAPWEV